MGNQQSAGVQFCSRGQLYTIRSETESYKSSDLEGTRVGYSSTKPMFQAQRIQKGHQQISALQQQDQEEIVEIPLAGPGTWKIPKNFLDMHPETEVKTPNEKDENDFTVFDGVYGNVIIDPNGLVLYTDITGKKHCEEHDRDEIEKIFPMGISRGGLTKTIWFNDADARDDCFEQMTTLPPPCYNAVMTNPSKFALLEESKLEEDEVDDNNDDDMNVFDGINDTSVIVHFENLILYTDINGNKHCVHYEKRNIKKCFPNGIHFGGLPRTIWLKDETERDLCFMLMQWNKDEVSEEEIPEEPSDQHFTGLYGGVILHPDSQIEYTALAGDHVKCFYEPSEIQEVFPKGISYGRLQKTIWFRDIEERTNCIDAMRKM